MRAISRIAGLSNRGRSGEKGRNIQRVLRMDGVAPALRLRGVQRALRLALVLGTLPLGIVSCAGEARPSPHVIGLTNRHRVTGRRTLPGVRGLSVFRPGVLRPRMLPRVPGRTIVRCMTRPRIMRRSRGQSGVGGTFRFRSVRPELRLWPQRCTARGLRPLRDPHVIRGRWRLGVVRGQRRLPGRRRRWQRIVRAQWWAGCEDRKYVRGGTEWGRWCSRRAWLGRRTGWWHCGCRPPTCRSSSLLPARRRGSVPLDVALAWVVLACIAQLCIPRLKSALSRITLTHCILPSITIASPAPVRVAIARLSVRNPITGLAPTERYISQLIQPEPMLSRPSLLKMVVTRELLTRTAEIQLAPGWGASRCLTAGTLATGQPRSTGIEAARPAQHRVTHVRPVLSHSSTTEPAPLGAGHPNVEAIDVERARAALSLRRESVPGLAPENLTEPRVARARMSAAHVTLARLAQVRSPQPRPAQVHLRGTRLTEVRVQRTCLVQVHLPRTRLTEVYLRRTCLIQVHLPRSRLVQGRLPWTRLTLAQVQQAHVMQAHVMQVHFVCGRLTRPEWTRVATALHVASLRRPEVRCPQTRCVDVLQHRSRLARLPPIGVAGSRVGLFQGTRLRTLSSRLGVGHALIAQGPSTLIGISATRPVHPPAPAFRARPPPRALGLRVPRATGPMLGYAPHRSSRAPQRPGAALTLILRGRCGPLASQGV